jgi:hypothetical protein
VVGRWSVGRRSVQESVDGGWSVVGNVSSYLVAYLHTIILQGADFGINLNVSKLNFPFMFKWMNKIQKGLMKKHFPPIFEFPHPPTSIAINNN